MELELAYSPFDIADPEQAHRVVQLQRLSYPVEAKRIGLDALPPMFDTVDTLVACGETFIGCFEGKRLVGAVSYKLDGETLDIHRLMVHPECFRRGIARSLLEAALSIPGARKAIVSTGSANVPAVRLYESFGFQETGRTEIAPGVTITSFERDLALNKESRIRNG